MSEADAIQRVTVPATAESLAADLRALGVREGMTLLVHASLSSLGWVCGGPQAMVQALLEVLGDTGTLVMPTHTTGNSDPAQWCNPPVPEHWWQVIRDHMPAFTPASPTRGMGAIAEYFRTLPHVSRSAHPQHSFAATGRYERAILRDHKLESGLGEDSPLARIYDLGGHVLLLGAGHRSNTSLHLSEHRAEWPAKSSEPQGAAMNIGGLRVWVRFNQLGYDPSDFTAIGTDFDETGHVRLGKVAAATARLMSQPELVRFGVEWISAHRA
jgi:aminoglycoside 3-N-acetyltransferase